VLGYVGLCDDLTKSVYIKDRVDVNNSISINSPTSQYHSTPQTESHKHVNCTGRRTSPRNGSQRVRSNLYHLLLQQLTLILRYIAGITIQKLLDAGYRVRGTVRNASAHPWMPSHYGPNFSIIEVPNMSLPCAMDAAVQGCDGIAHIASPTSDAYNPDPQAVIPMGIRCALELLEAAAREPSVKSVVYTSSQAAAVMLVPGKKYHITPESWNEESKAAWTMPVTPDFRRMLFNYMCAKTEAEQQSFAWVKEHKPQFTFNSVVPNLNFGTVTRPDKTGFVSSSGVLKLLWSGNAMPADIFPPEWFVDVEDTALLHLAALTLPDVRNERIIAMAGRFCYNEILDIYRQIAPDRTFLENIEEVLDEGTVDNERAEGLLRKVKGGEGFFSLEDAVKKLGVQMLRSEEEGKEGRKWPESTAEGMAKMFEGVPKEMRSLYA
jgi:nucleoside-diphosphate-sugar epimerase